MERIPTTNSKLLALLALSVTAIGLASAQSVRHDVMDARAAAKDIRRLQQDRARAARHHNWKKVAQDDRLIAADRHFIHKDIRKAEHGH